MAPNPATPITPDCPVCTMPDPLLAEDGFECGTCGHEWMGETDDGIGEVRDVNGKLLSSGDEVVIVKDLKVDGKVGGIKVGTKVRAIRLIAGDHPIQGKVNGRVVMITSDKVKKA